MVIAVYVTVGVLLGFAMLLFAAAGTRFMPARSVTVVPVIVKRAELQQAGTTLFQAPGWIEPRPTAISVAAMDSRCYRGANGRGRANSTERGANRTIGFLDAELVLEQTKNALAIREGELNRAKAELSAARIRFENPVHCESILRCKEQFNEIKDRVSQTAFSYRGCGI